MNPTFSTVPVDVFVFTDDKFVLPCYAVSYPYPTFYWQRNSVPLSIDTTSSMSMHIKSLCCYIMYHIVFG